MRLIITGSRAYLDQPAVFVVLEQIFLSGGGEEIVLYHEPLAGLDRIVTAISRENADLGFVDHVTDFDSGLPPVDGLLAFFQRGADGVRGEEILERARVAGLLTMAFRE